MSLSPKEKDRKKFDLDLAYGKVREELVKEMLQDKKIEVKSERDVWKRTGNIAISMRVGTNLQVFLQLKLTTGFTTYVLVMKHMQH